MVSSNQSSGISLKSAFIVARICSKHFINGQKTKDSSYTRDIYMAKVFCDHCEI